MAPPPCSNIRGIVLHREPDAFDINVHHSVEVGFGLIDERFYITLDAGIVEGQIEPAVRRHRVIHQRLNLSGNRNVRSPKAGCPADVADHRDYFLAALNVAISDNDLCSFASKRQRCATADS
jgi:hypothetical protein